MEAAARYRFDNFVVGSANRLAVAAARAVAESPGATDSPLFIYSASGLGKTHLMRAVGHLAATRNPLVNVEIASLDALMEGMHAAVSAGEGDTFKSRYQHVDILLIDDIQFLTGRRETQVELLRLFNALTAAGRQIVLTSDRAPSDIADVDERLLARLGGGLIVDLGAPDYETRVAILRTKCDERGIQFAPGVVEELARVGSTNVRELLGALNRLAVHRESMGELRAEQVRSLLGLAPEPAAPGLVGEFQSFLSNVAIAVAQHVDAWHSRDADAVVDRFFLDDEKIVWDWPDIGGRVIEEMR